MAFRDKCAFFCDFIHINGQMSSVVTKKRLPIPTLITPEILQCVLQNHG